MDLLNIHNNDRMNRMKWMYFAARKYLCTKGERSFKIAYYNMYERRLV